MRYTKRFFVSTPSFSPLPLSRRPAPFPHPDWIFEVKYDGFRALAHLNPSPWKLRLASVHIPLGVWKEISARQREQKARRVKDIGMWRLSFTGRKDGREEAGCDIENKWSKYLGAWHLLDEI